jgi:Beta-galactosidase
MNAIMRSAALAAFTAALLTGILQAQRGAEPFLPVGVTYELQPSAPRDQIASDLQSIHRLGYNTVTTAVRWADAEPARGQFRFDSLTRLLDLASGAGLRAIVRLDTRDAPDWVLAQYPDARLQTAAPKGAGLPPRVCLDHSSARAAAAAFVSAVRELASRAPGLHALDVGSDLQHALCVCPHTRRRYDEWSRQTGDTDRALFVAAARREDLKQLTVPEHRARPVVSLTPMPSVLRQDAITWPGQDDWLMSTVVDLYGMTVSSALMPDLALALDDVASASRDRGWWMRADASVPRNEARMVGWAAVARGARALTFARGHDLEGLPGAVARNPYLFLQLIPRQSKIAILYDPRSVTADGTGAQPASDATAFKSLHRTLLEQNIAVDVLHTDELTRDAAARYRAIVNVSRRDLSRPAAQALAVAASRGQLIHAIRDKLTGETLLERTRKAGIAPEVRISGAQEPIETRFLESDSVLMLIAINHAGVSQKVTMTFSPDTQEAIWLNMETGAGVNFVAGPEGPTYGYWFRPHDALVLMIRKDIR